jgi:hypothetical protein
VALLDLSLVTKALTTLLEKGIEGSRRWGGTPPTFGVVPCPPDQLEGQALGLYLVHVTEDPSFKNPPPAGLGQPQVRFTPMALQLVYQLTAHGADADLKTRTLHEQNLLGLAMKVLHDFPSIADGTTVLDKNGNAVEVLPADMRGRSNRIRISLLPFTQSETMGLWTGGHQRPPRLAIYYQVSVVLLQADTIQETAQRVLRYGIDVQVGGAPYVEGTESTLHFQLPDEPPSEIVVRPAQVPAGDPASSAVTFTGANLDGSGMALLLQGPKWQEPLETGFAVGSAAGRLTVDLQEKAAGRTLVPGVYSATLRVTRRVASPDGGDRSNVAPIVVLPRIDRVVPAGAALRIEGFVFEDPDIPADGIQVRLMGRTLTRSAGAPAAGGFRVVGPRSIDLRPPAGLGPGTYPIAVTVNGATSPPAWVVLQ